MTEVSETKKPKYSKNDLMHMMREDLVGRFLKQQNQVEYLNDKFEKLNDETIELKDVNVKLNARINENAQKEAILIHKLSRKDQEINDYLAQLHDINKQLQVPSSLQLHSCLLDPAVNITIQNLTKELDTYKEKLQLAQEDLAAVKFSPDSQLGKRLVEKCRTLQKENEELGQMLKSGSVAKLESELAMKQLIIDSFVELQNDVKEVVDDDEIVMCGMEFALKDMTEKLKAAQQHMKTQQSEIDTLKKTLEKAHNVNSNVDKTPSLSKRNDDVTEKLSTSRDKDHKVVNASHKQPPSSSSKSKEENSDAKNESDQRLKKHVSNTNNNNYSGSANNKTRQKSRSPSKEKVKKSTNSSPESPVSRHNDDKKTKNYENCNGRNRSRSPKFPEKVRNVGSANDYGSRRNKSPYGHYNESSDKNKKRKYDDDYDENVKSRRFDDDRSRERDRDRTKHSEYSSRPGRTAY